MKIKPKNIGLKPPLFKIDLKLKLTTLLFLVAIFNVKAHTYAQAKVSLELKNSSIERVIETIEQKTDFRFIYNINDIDLDRTISINVKDQPINIVLDKIFKGTSTGFKVTGTQIILKKEKPKADSASIKEKIKGRVTDENGLPLPGANVLEEGTSNAVATDMDGNFEINVANKDAVLIVSYVGYMDVKLTAGKLPEIIKMVPDAAQLEEVVVIGYGTTTKKDVTGAVASISAKDMNQGAITSPQQLIAGKLAGVVVNQTGSEPGSAPSIRIRGVSSLRGGSDPLVVVDGIQGGMELLNQVAPGDIATIDVLKDASATAIYGSRGAPGVIIVTLKKSKPGTTYVEFAITTAIDFIPNKLDMLSADEWWAEAQKIGVPASANHGANTDWYGILTKSGITQTTSLSFGGGTDKFNYRASVSAVLQDGVVIESSNKKFIGNLQATQLALDDKLKLTFNLNSGVRENTGMVQSIGRESFTSNLISQAYVMRPTDPVYNTDGTYFTDPNVFKYLNPYAVTQTTTSEYEHDNLFGSLKADLDLADGLTAGWFGSWRKTSYMEGFFIPVESTDANAINQNGFANIRNNRSNEKLMDISLTYKKTFGKHDLNLLGVYEWQNQIYQGNYMQARGFVNDATTYNALQLGNISKVLPGDMASSKSDRSLVSYLARANYSFLGRYLFTASIRRDGSSVFGANYKWGNFPSASVGWQIDQEPFMANQNVVNQLKLRGGYGVTGNQQGLIPQQSLALVGLGEIPTIYFGDQIITNYTPSQNANADLRWETKTQTNIGLDFAMLNSRLRGTIDVYTATTDNLLFNYLVPQPPYPVPFIYANAGSLKNEGLEVSLAYDLISTENTRLTLAGNVSFLRNEVLSLSGSINGIPLNSESVGWGPNAFLIKGQPIGTFNILHHTGKDDQNSETVLDVNGDGIIDQGNISPDRRLSGSALPTYTFAFNPTFQYKDFDFSMLWRGSGGNKIYNSIRATLSYEENIGKSNILASAVPLGLFNSKYGSDLWLEDGDFIRLDNVTAGYNLKLKEVKYIDAIRFSITGNNLLLITDYSGLDPELNFSGNEGAGGDNGIYPRTRSIAFGLNVKFK